MAGRPKKTAVEKKTQTVANTTKPVAEEKTSVAGATETKAEEVKTEKPVEAVASEPVAAKKTEEKPAARKASAKKQTPAKRQTKKVSVETVEEVYVEYGDNKQIMTGDIVNRIKEAYKSEGHRISSIKSLKVYINLSDHKAYYVINEKAEGKSVDL